MRKGAFSRLRVFPWHAAKVQPDGHPLPRRDSQTLRSRRSHATCRSGAEAVGCEPTRRLPAPPGFKLCTGRLVRSGPVLQPRSAGRRGPPPLPADENVRRIGSQFGSQSAVVDLLIRSPRGGRVHVYQGSRLHNLRSCAVTVGKPT
jgi:hypothetical protein